MEYIREKILIVDDEFLIRKLLCQKLTKVGYDCAEADSVNNALKKIETDPIGLVISDIRMPEKSGIELLGIVKENYPDTPVIMATGVAEMDMAIDCLKHGADDYITKPFDLERVRESVQKSLEKRESRLINKLFHEQLEETIKQQSEQIKKLSLGAIESLVIALEAKDKYTAGHSKRVGEIALTMAREIGLSKEDLENLRWGSLLHDVGKIAVDQVVQNKPGRLTAEEHEHIMIHSQVGAEIVRPVVNPMVVEIVEHHHDRYDGEDSHQAISGKDIPLGARILAVADTFDAMTSDRPYRRALPIAQSLAEIQKCGGSQFDPEIVNVFLKLYTPESVMPEA